MNLSKFILISGLLMSNVLMAKSYTIELLGISADPDSRVASTGTTIIPTILPTVLIKDISVSLHLSKPLEVNKEELIANLPAAKDFLAGLPMTNSLQSFLNDLRSQNEELATITDTEICLAMAEASEK